MKGRAVVGSRVVVDPAFAKVNYSRKRVGVILFIDRAPRKNWYLVGHGKGYPGGSGGPFAPDGTVPAKYAGHCEWYERHQIEVIQ